MINALSVNKNELENKSINTLEDVSGLFNNIGIRAVLISDIAQSMDFYLSQLTYREVSLFTDFRNPKRQIHWLAGRVAAKRAIIESVFWDQDDPPEILRNRCGAPIISGHDDVWLSISHSNNIAIAAVALFPIGIDIERIEPRPDSFLKLFFTPREQRHFQNLIGEEKITGINKAWTCKEAVSKVLGLGGALYFNTISSLHLPVVDPITQLAIDLKSFLYKGYMFSVAYSHSAGEVKISG